MINLPISHIFSPSYLSPLSSTLKFIFNSLKPPLLNSGKTAKNMLKIIIYGPRSDKKYAQNHSPNPHSYCRRYILFCFPPSPKPENFGDNVSAVIKDTPYYLEVAKTYSTRQTGLSHRTQLCSNCGMLFVFDREGKHPFWMKDTKIPLDIIWLNSKFEVVDFVTATETDSIKSFANSQPAMYVIELNANEVFKLNLKRRYHPTVKYHR